MTSYGQSVNRTLEVSFGSLLEDLLFKTEMGRAWVLGCSLPIMGQVRALGSVPVLGLDLNLHRA